MKDFLDYVSEITVKEPVHLDQYSTSIEIFIGGNYIDAVWKHEKYCIIRRGSIEYKLIGERNSFFTEDIIYTKLLRYRFL